MSDQLLTLISNKRAANLIKLRNAPAQEIAAFKNQFLPAEEKRQSRGGLKL